MQRLNPSEPKPLQVNFLISTDLKQKLEAMSGRTGNSAFIRSLIERAWEEHQEGEGE